MADEKEQDRRTVLRRRISWQAAIFLIAVTINLLVTFRERFILDS
jgi:hypothetical protein